jgi:excisionase family DNA binding protein
METKYHRKQDEAARLGVGSRTLDRWVASRAIPYRRLGRVLLFDPAEVDAVLADKWNVAAVGTPRRCISPSVTEAS